MPIVKLGRSQRHGAVLIVMTWQVGTIIFGGRGVGY